VVRLLVDRGADTRAATSAMSLQSYWSLAPPG
jgi:hypothetical protein